MTPTKLFRRAVERFAVLEDVGFDTALWVPTYALHDRLLDTGRGEDGELAEAARERPAAKLVGEFRAFRDYLAMLSKGEVVFSAHELFVYDSIPSPTAGSSCRFDWRSPLDDFYIRVSNGGSAAFYGRHLSPPISHRWDGLLRGAVDKFGGHVWEAWTMTVKRGPEPLEVAP